jgi:DNA-binding NarL/FixJ family response regulator
MAETTVALIDDHQTLLDLLSLAITAEHDLAVVGTATTAAAGRRLVDRTEPDVVLLDFALPDGDGITLATELAEHHPQIRVVMLTASQDAALISRAAAAGAAGLVAKSGALGQVLKTIRSARTGSMVVDPILLAGLTPAPPDPQQFEDARAVRNRPQLTVRELDVLALLAVGKDARTIAHELLISLHTCRGYVKSLLAKLESHSQLEAVVKAGRLGLLPGPALIPAARLG